MKKFILNLLLYFYIFAKIKIKLFPKKLLLILLISVSAFAQTARKYSNEFLNIGVNAAALGMSNAVVAHTDDVHSGYWNPAGLVRVKDKQIALMHASYFANIAQYDYAAYAAPIDSVSSFGISLIRFGVDNILNTTQLIDSQGNIDYNRISTFSAADYAGILSYARKSKIKNLNYGANAKIVRRIIGDFANSWGFGFDIGAQYQYQNWKFGIMIKDITTTVNVWSFDEKGIQDIQNSVPGKNQELPEKTEITLPKLQLGVARNFLIKEKYSLLTAFNLNTRFAQTNDIISSEKMSIDPALGFQFGYANVVFVRAGLGNFQKITQFDNSQKTQFQPNAGIGFQYRKIAIDYALTNIGDTNGGMYSNIFSLKVDFSAFAKK